MNAMWQMYINRFSPETCNRIISLAKLLPEKNGTMSNAERLDTSYRSSKVRFIPHTHKDFSDFYLEIVDMFHECNKNAFGADLWNLTQIQFTEYKSEYSGKYEWHNDVNWDGQTMHHRKLSMVIQLTDPSEYEGADLEMQPLFLGPPDREQLRQQGTVIVFPSFLMHRVTQITSGTRHSLVAWIDGPKWR